MKRPLTLRIVRKWMMLLQIDFLPILRSVFKKMLNGRKYSRFVWKMKLRTEKSGLQQCVECSLSNGLGVRFQDSDVLISATTTAATAGVAATIRLPAATTCRAAASAPTATTSVHFFLHSPPKVVGRGE
jgi:hypothetical protein